MYGVRYPDNLKVDQPPKLERRVVRWQAAHIPQLLCQKRKCRYDVCHSPRKPHKVLSRRTKYVRQCIWVVHVNRKININISLCNLD